MIEIFDNYLSEEIFEQVLHHINFGNICWNFAEKANPESYVEKQFQFFHYMVENGENLYEGADVLSKQILYPFMFKKKRNLLLIRSRINFYIKVEDSQFGLGYHIDMDNTPSKPYTLLLYLEDSNGCTEFEKCGTRIESKRNRACVFPAGLRHQTITSSDSLFRKNINLNFLYQKT